jgi:hypothetical protein
MTISSSSVVLTHHKAHSGVFGRQDGKDLLLRITGVVCSILQPLTYSLSILLSNFSGYRTG